MSLREGDKANIYSVFGPDCEGKGCEPINGSPVTPDQEAVLGAKLAAELAAYKKPGEEARQAVFAAFATAQTESRPR